MTGSVKAICQKGPPNGQKPQKGAKNWAKNGSFLTPKTLASRGFWSKKGFLAAARGVPVIL